VGAKEMMRQVDENEVDSERSAEILRNEGSSHWVPFSLAVVR